MIPKFFTFSASANLVLSTLFSTFAPQNSSILHLPGAKLTPLVSTQFGIALNLNAVSFIVLAIAKKFDSLVAFFLLSLTDCFARVCFPTLLATVWNFFLHLTTCAVSREANSNKSAPTRFAAGTTC